MTINSLKDGDCGVIVRVNADDKMRERLFSFGIVKSGQIKRIKSSLGGSTILVEIDRNCVALRAEEAESILIEQGENVCKM
ncbi:FeoA family protein [Helicobacter turcicus]|uniref:FeoA domain-containing protein n=1 Tax=Helicobacter turcicus TaxID=2867412 RepID=A0ABS7JKR4_9HELI|nr:FeoA domain-containing protein [Helicobacter turcicus]MBX7489983.1 FeoA domain-containing protein [Helicobacter turcicus]MBX7544842.1 FeoA domain-containing protein [Helicobacter turcicus]